MQKIWIKVKTQMTLATIHRKSSQKLKALPLDHRSKKAKKSKPGGIGFFGLKALGILGSNLNALHLNSSDVDCGVET